MFQGAVPVLAHFGDGVHPKHPVAFKLRFAEPLVTGRLVRKLLAGLLVVEDIARFVTRDGWLDVDQESIACVRSVHLVVSNLADGTVAADLVGITRVNVETVHVDRHSKIDANFADGVSEVFKLAFGIAPRITHDDEAASPQHHLVEAKILEVPAVGEINVIVVIVGKTEGLLGNVKGGVAWGGFGVAMVAGWARVSEPGAEPNIAERHQR